MPKLLETDPTRLLCRYRELYEREIKSTETIDEMKDILDALGISAEEAQAKGLALFQEAYSIGDA